VVFGALTEDKIERKRLGENATGLAVRMDVKGTVDSILQLQPETQRVVVIGGTAPLDKLFLSKAEEAARSLSGRVRFDFWLTRPMGEIKNVVASLPQQISACGCGMFNATTFGSRSKVAASLVGETLSR
jgi:hypothetical protein